MRAHHTNHEPCPRCGGSTHEARRQNVHWLACRRCDWSSLHPNRPTAVAGVAELGEERAHHG